MGGVGSRPASKQTRNPEFEIRNAGAIEAQGVQGQKCRSRSESPHTLVMRIAKCGMGNGGQERQPVGRGMQDDAEHCKAMTERAERRKGVAGEGVPERLPR